MSNPIEERVKKKLGLENKWFRDLILSELQTLQLMRLKGAPSEDTIVLVGYLWVEALWDGKKWEISDKERIEKAFLEIRKTAKEWVQPITVLEYLPKKASLLALSAPIPKYDPQKAAANLAFIRQGLKGAINV